ncbi:MAG: hypothetical protein JWO32_2081 [Bacteroidetes bacterium]|nr:hypothetical protein [Bacteroidota bacterium]
MKKIKLLFFVLACMFLCLNCKKKKVDPHVPPDVTFKTGGKFISGDVTRLKNDTMMVGITATKTEDNLKSYNISVAYDGASTTTTKFNYLMLESEYEWYSHDYQLITRNQTGSERWVFSIVDRDGNITQKTINITVQ